MIVAHRLLDQKKKIREKQKVDDPKPNNDINLSQKIEQHCGQNMRRGVSNVVFFLKLL
jgi:hypothetical protein